MKGDLICPASPRQPVRGAVLRLEDPFSFWGGVDPGTGNISDPRSANYGRSVTDKVLVIRELRGSSSTSAVLLELIYRELAPAAIIVSSVDAILVLGTIVAREMGWRAPPIVRLPADEHIRLAEASIVGVDRAGDISVCG